MGPRVFLGLLAVTVIAAAAALLTALTQPTAAPVRYVDEPAFPALRDNPDAVAKVALTTPAGSFTLVRETGDRWSALERFGYPVDDDQVRALIVALADMRLIEAKTRLPERYGRLEVEDVEGQGREVAAAARGKRRRQGSGRGDLRQAAAPPDRQSGRGHLSAPAGRGPELARERRRRDRRRR